MLSPIHRDIDIAARPSSKEHLRCSRVNCLFELNPATSKAKTIRFNVNNPRTNKFMSILTFNACFGEKASRRALAKAFQPDKHLGCLFDQRRSTG